MDAQALIEISPCMSMSVWIDSVLRGGCYGSACQSHIPWKDLRTRRMLKWRIHLASRVEIA